MCRPNYATELVHYLSGRDFCVSVTDWQLPLTLLRQEVVEEEVEEEVEEAATAEAAVVWRGGMRSSGFFKKMLQKTLYFRIDTALTNGPKLCSVERT